MKAKYILLFTAIMGIAMFSCVEDEIFQGPPVISNVTITPQAPNVGELVTVTAKVVDLNGVDEVSLFYKVGAGTFIEVAMTASGSDMFSGAIPAQAGGTSVSYYIEALNVIGKTILSPSNAPATTAA